MYDVTMPLLLTDALSGAVVTLDLFAFGERDAGRQHAVQLLQVHAQQILTAASSSYYGGTRTHLTAHA